MRRTIPRPELDPTKNHELLDEFSQCVSADDIMLALEKQIIAFNDFRNDRWAKLREKLKPVVEVALLVTKVVGDYAQSIVCFTPHSTLRVYNFASHRASLATKACSRPSVFY